MGELVSQIENLPNEAKTDENTNTFVYTTKKGEVKYVNTLDDNSVNKDETSDAFGDDDFGDVENTITVDNTANDKNITELVQSVEIVDPKLAELPSTGGAGTVAITIISSIAMAVFLTIHIVNKRKSRVAD